MRICPILLDVSNIIENLFIDLILYGVDTPITNLHKKALCCVQFKYEKEFCGGYKCEYNRLSRRIYIEKMHENGIVDKMVFKIL